MTGDNEILYDNFLLKLVIIVGETKTRKLANSAKRKLFHLPVLAVQDSVGLETCSQHLGWFAVYDWI